MTHLIAYIHDKTTTLSYQQFTQGGPSVVSTSDNHKGTDKYDMNQNSNMSKVLQNPSQG